MIKKILMMGCLSLILTSCSSGDNDPPPQVPEPPSGMYKTECVESSNEGAYELTELELFAATDGVQISFIQFNDMNCTNEISRNDGLVYEIDFQGNLGNGVGYAEIEVDENDSNDSFAPYKYVVSEKKLYLGEPKGRSEVKKDLKQEFAEFIKDPKGYSQFIFDKI